MTKARDLANLIAAGNPLADGAISVAEISDLTASAAELNNVAGINSSVQTQLDSKASASDLTTAIDGLGTASALDVGTGANQVVQLNGSAQLPAVDGSQLTGVSSTAVGTLQYFSGAETVNYPGNKWLKCDGTTYNKSDYTDLSTIVGSLINGTSNSIVRNTEITDTMGGLYHTGTKFLTVNETPKSTTDFQSWTSVSGAKLDVGALRNKAQDSNGVLFMGRQGNTAWYSSDGGNTILSRDQGTAFDYLDYDTSDNVWGTFSGNTIKWTNDITTNSGYGSYTLTTGGGNPWKNQPWQVRYTGVGRYWVGVSYYMNVCYTSDITSNNWSNPSQFTSNDTSNFFAQIGIIKSQGVVVIGRPTTGEVYRSTNGAQSFSLVKTFSGGLTTIYEVFGADELICVAGGVIYISTDGNTWTQKGPSPTGYINSVTKVGSTYYMQGSTVAIASTTDFVNYTYLNGYNGQNQLGYNSLVHDGTHYINASVGGTITKISDDFSTIELAAGDFSGTSFCIEYESSSGKYAVGSDSGQIKITTDLSTWTTSNTGSTNSVTMVKYLNGAWWAGTSGGQLYTSTDLVSWTLKDTTSGRINDMAYGNSKYVVIRNGGLINSSDGNTWTASSTNFTVDQGFNILFANGKFTIAAREGYSQYAGIVASSTTGENFTSDLTFPTGAKPVRVGFSNGIYLLLIEDGNMYSSADAAVWVDLKVQNTGAKNIISNDTSSFMVAATALVEVPFYTYNQATQFVVPTQGSANIATGESNLFIRSEA